MVRLKGLRAPEHGTGGADAKGSGSPRRGPRRYRAIAASLLDLLLQSSAETHPNEFSGVLSSKGGELIDDLLLVPGTISGDRHAIVSFYNIASGRPLIGSVHSHPSPYPFPSEADLQFFSRLGDVHLIVAHPYTRRSWRAWDVAGRELHLEVVER